MTGVMALTTAAVTTAPAATAAETFSCQSSVTVFDVRSNGHLYINRHEEPETGVNLWSGDWVKWGEQWPASTYAGPAGKVYSINAAGELLRHVWLGNGWENGGTSTKIDQSDNYKVYNTNPAYQKRFTVDATGDFYRIDLGGSLRMRRYNETSNEWYEWVIDGGWDKYNAIFASGDGVLYARTPAGELYRFRYHKSSQRWVSRSGAIAGNWNTHKHMISPGADILYGLHGTQNTGWWYRYSETENKWAAGSGTNQFASWWAADSIAAVAAPDSCPQSGLPVPGTPAVTVNRTAKATLLKTTNGYLQYAYVDNEGHLVHSEIRDIAAPNPNGFSAFPGYASFTGVPAVSENENGQVRVYGHGTDSNTHGYIQQPPNWSSHNNMGGRTSSAAQFVRTDNKLQTWVAIDWDGSIWIRPQRMLNGAMYGWRRTLGSTAMSAGTKEFTTFASGNTIVVIALHTNGQQCRFDITNEAASALRCSGPTGFTGAASAIKVGDGIFQLFARRNDGKIYTTRTNADGSIQDTWTPMAGTLPEGVTPVGAPSAVMAPNTTMQVATRGSDGYVYRSGQLASGSTAWTPWTEVTKYSDDTAVDPTLSLAGDTWVVAFRTTAGVPQLWRFVPGTGNTTLSTEAAGNEFVSVPLQR